MNILIYDRTASVLSAGLIYVITTNFPDARVTRTTEMPPNLRHEGAIDLLILFQEQGQPVRVEEWQRVKEYCNHPPCFGLLDEPTFKNLKSLLCAFPMNLLANAKEMNDELILKVIDHLDSGGIFFSSSIIAMLHDHLCKCDDDDEANIHLTKREAQVLEGIRNGKTAQAIAEEMKLSVNTVQVFLAKVRKKFKVRHTHALVQRK